MVQASLAELVSFAADVYGFRWQNHVGVFITTEDGVILIDPCGQTNLRTPALFKEAVRSVTDAPVKYVVYSHWGADHGMGGAVFADTAQFVGHRNTVEKIVSANDPASPAPQVVFDKKTSLELGGKKLDLYPADLSPTDDYLVVDYPASRLVMFVDLVQPRGIPFRTLLGEPDRIVERLRWVESLDFEVLVSGHANPRMTCTKEDVAEQRQYYLDLMEAIATAHSAGMADGSPKMAEAVRARLQPKYGAWRRFDEFVALNVEGVIGWRAGKNLRFT